MLPKKKKSEERVPWGGEKSKRPQTLSLGVEGSLGEKPQPAISRGK